MFGNPDRPEIALVRFVTLFLLPIYCTMKRTFLVAAAIVAAIFACTRLSQAPAPTTDPPIANCFCGDTIHCQQFCSQLPIDVTEKFNPGYDGALTPTFQPPFDVFSWQTFIALNWPADAKGNPMKCSIGDSLQAPRVWERLH